MGRVLDGRSQGFLKRLAQEERRHAASRKLDGARERDLLLSKLGNGFTDYVEMFSTNALSMIGTVEALGKYPYGVPLLILQELEGVLTWELCFSMKQDFALVKVGAGDYETLTDAARMLNAVDDLLVSLHLMGAPTLMGREARTKQASEQSNLRAFLSECEFPFFHVGRFNPDYCRITRSVDVVAVQGSAESIRKSARTNKLYVSSTGHDNIYLVSGTKPCIKKGLFIWRDGAPVINAKGAVATVDAFLLGALNQEPYSAPNSTTSSATEML